VRAPLCFELAAPDKTRKRAVCASAQTRRRLCDASGVRGATFRALGCKTLIFFESAAPLNSRRTGRRRRRHRRVWDRRRLRAVHRLLLRGGRVPRLVRHVPDLRRRRAGAPAPQHERARPHRRHPGEITLAYMLDVCLLSVLNTKNDRPMLKAGSVIPSKVHGGEVGKFVLVD
jgi:hypothetical protein